MSDGIELRFAYRSWLRPLFIVLGSGPKRARVIVDDTMMGVDFGPAFSCTVPLDAIEQTEPSRTSWWAVGAHTNLRGSWIINGDVGPAVTVTLTSPARGRTLGVPVKVRRLVLGVAEPDRLLELLR